MIYTIIPVYNCKKYLESAVNSVLNQQYKKINIVLVDDGSSDGSSELCDKISINPRVSVIHTKNNGVSMARNTGIKYVLDKEELVDDDYFAFLDSDDLWVANAIDEKIVSKFENNDIVGFGTYISNNTCKRMKLDSEYTDTQYQIDGRADTRWLFKGHFGAHFYKCKLIKNFNLSFMENAKNNEDVVFIRECFFSAEKVLLLSNILYIYRTNYTSVTHTYKINFNNALDIPKLWDNAREWCNKSSMFSFDQKLKWNHICDSLVGMRMLEVCRMLAEIGCSEGDIRQFIFSTELTTHLDALKESELADWQVDDLKLFRNDFSKFVECFNKRGKRQKKLNLLKNNKLFLWIYDHYNYRIKI